MDAASSSTKITVVQLQRSFISPPPQSNLPKTIITLPLTFLDVPWLLFSPSQTIFFYEFPTSTNNFIENILPKLEHSLYVTLRHYFPLAGNLVTYDLCEISSSEPVIEYSEGDRVCLTVAANTNEAAAAGLFKNLVANHQRLARDFHNLVPAAGSKRKNGLQAETSHTIDDGMLSTRKKPLFAIKITIFPECGISMGFTLRHVIADGRTFDKFLKTWAGINKNGMKSFEIDPFVTCHDRSIIRDPCGLKSIFLKEWWNINNKKINHDSTSNVIDHDNLMRTTFVMGPSQMEKIKNWISTLLESLFGSTQLLLTPYVIACAYIWFCWMKTHWPFYDHHDDGIIHCFGFIAGGMTRLNYPITNNYVGNFVAFGRASMTRAKLTSKNGIAHSAKAIGDAIKKLNADALSGAENWISEWEEMRGSELHVTVTGSPKVGVYSLDFGFGLPVKMEELSIDGKGEISLCEAKDVVGGIEIGLVLPKSKMDAFSGLFNKGLKHDYVIINGS